MKALICFASALGLLSSRAISAQDADRDQYSRKNTFAVFGEYANDSSRILLGNAVNRKVGAVGLRYERSVVHTRNLSLSYAAEIRPGVWESDPTVQFSGVQTSPNPSTFIGGYAQTFKCVASTASYKAVIDGVTYVGTTTERCGRQATFSESFAPVGFRVNGFTRKRLQPTFSTNEGYIFSTRAIPIPYAGTFNFTFEFGAGVEYFYSPKHSVRLEYQIQHYSNAYTAENNPGVDNGLFKVTYAFGR